MSFYCPWQDGQFETCRRTGETKCVPGKPGCVLFGKVAFAEDAPERRAPTRRKRPPKSSPSTGIRPQAREELLGRLEALPATLAAICRSPRNWAETPSPGGWTAAQIVHHLADVHAAGLARVRRALSEDSPLVERYDHERWAQLPDAKDPKMVRASLSLLEGVHARWCALLRGIPSDAWSRAYRHPDQEHAISIEEDLAWHVQHGEDHLRRLS